ncbi:MAG: patatin family protein [Clostridia bacterium]|nr:patatin family protein [Clostridia bacterium]
MKTGLILEGGAMRGLFSCGVMDVMMEKGVRFDGAGGISAGAVFGCNYKSGQIGRPLRYNKRYCADWRYASLRSLILTGDLFGADFCYRELPDVLDPFDKAAFARDPMAFYVGATDVETGKAVYHLCTDGGKEDILWMRASASMPLLSRMVEIGEKRYLDGGVAEPTPYFYMESIGYDRNVVILTRPADYRKEKNRLLPLIRLRLRGYPSLVRAMETRHEAYNRHIDAIAQREKEGRALVIRPPRPLGIGHVERDPDELERVYQLGRAEALRRMGELEAFLGR